MSNYYFLGNYFHFPNIKQLIEHGIRFSSYNDSLKKY